MLSGRGIDGELKSKFGELTENFWKSSSWGKPGGTKNFQAIYLTNGEGSNGGGEELRELKGDGKSKLLKGTEGSVKKFFGYCVGGRNSNGCEGNKNNASVVLVGDDPDINSSLTWEKLKSENWGQTSLVRSGRVYNGLFDNKFWSGHSQRTGNVVSLNNDTENGQMKSVSYRKGGMWTIRLCSERDNCDTRNSGLNVTVGENRLCVSTVVCVNGSDIKTHYQSLRKKWEEVKGSPGTGGLWNTVFGDEGRRDHLERLLVALLVACFSDVKSVSLTVQKPSKKGDLIFAQLNNKK